MCNDIGIIEKIVLSDTSSNQAKIYTNGKFIDVMPPKKYALLRALISFPVYRRIILSNLFRRNNCRSSDPDIDMSMEEFMKIAFRYPSDEDRDFILYTVLDAFQLGIYSGELNKLSARFCFPISEIFKKKVLMNLSHPDDLYSKSLEPSVTDGWALDLYQKAEQKMSSALNFIGGMEVLPQGILKYLKHLPNFKLIPENVVDLRGSSQKDEVLVRTNTQSITADYVISTIPSPKLAEILDSKRHVELINLCNSIQFNSLKTVNLGFERLNLKGVGYLVPTREKSKISGVLYDSSSFPYLRHSVSIMAKPENSVEDMISTFREQTGVNEPHVLVNVNNCVGALPQYHVGHHKIVDAVEKISPPWLSVSGQSFYLSGVPNLVNRSKILAEKLVMTKRIKSIFAK